MGILWQIENICTKIDMIFDNYFDNNQRIIRYFDYNEMFSNLSTLHEDLLKVNL